MKLSEITQITILRDKDGGRWVATWQDPKWLWLPTADRVVVYATTPKAALAKLLTLLSQEAQHDAH
jgi:hypothetical protein